MLRYTVKTTGAKEAIKFMQKLDPATMRAAKKGYQKYGDVLEKQLKQVWSDDTHFNGSGRIAASIGHYDAKYLVYQSSDPNNVSSPDDAFYELRQKGRQIIVRIGTNVPYAIYQEYGFTMSNPGVIPIESRRSQGIKFRYVNTFTKEGLHIFENVTRSMEQLANFYIGDALKEAGWNVDLRRYKYSDKGSQFMVISQ